MPGQPEGSAARGSRPLERVQSTLRRRNTQSGPGHRSGASLCSPWILGRSAVKVTLLFLVQAHVLDEIRVIVQSAEHLGLL